MREAISAGPELVEGQRITVNGMGGWRNEPGTITKVRDDGYVEVKLDSLPNGIQKIPASAIVESPNYFKNQ